MNKQDIFPLYLNSNIEIMHENELLSGWFSGYLLEENEEGTYWALSTDNCDCFYPVNDCQLILKRISDMSEDGKKFIVQEKEFSPSGYVDALKGVFEQGVPNLSEASVNVVLWLIQNGYALDDEWFTNGIAIEDKE